MEFGAITVGVSATIEEKIQWIKNAGMSVWQPGAGELGKEDPKQVC